LIGIVAMSEVWRRLEPLPGNRAACELFLQRDEPACDFKSVAVDGSLVVVVSSCPIITVSPEK
jgi:hypothetical protein